MSKCLLLVGPICSGKTMLAETLMQRGFLRNRSNFYGIEQSRKLLSDGTMAGELDAWAGFLRQIQSPSPNDNAIYEFSGTGRHVYSVSWAIGHSIKDDPNTQWIIAYCLAPETTIRERFPKKVYDSPMPFAMGSPLNSLAFMNGELEKSYGNSREWNGSMKMKFNMNVENYDGIADQISAAFIN
jgi:hypothetical protein